MDRWISILVIKKKMDPMVQRISILVIKKKKMDPTDKYFSY
jgi:hypothetical protein